MKTVQYFPNYDMLIRTLELQLLINSLHIESKGSWFDSQCLHFAWLRDPTFTAGLFEISLLWTKARKKNTPLFLLFFISNLKSIFYLKHNNYFDSFLARSFYTCNDHIFELSENLKTSSATISRNIISKMMWRCWCVADTKV